MDHKKCTQEIKLLRSLLKKTAATLRKNYSYFLYESRMTSKPAKFVSDKMKKCIHELSENGF